MAFTQGSIITGIDYNTLRANAIQLLGTGSGDVGFGQNNLTWPYISPEIITPNKVIILYDNIRKAYDHVNGYISYYNNPLFGTVAKASIFDDIINRYNYAYNNRLSTSNSLVYKIQNIANTYSFTYYQGTRHAIFEFRFNSYNHARYFFNGGGAVAITMSHPDGVENGPNRAFRLATQQIGILSLRARFNAKSGTRGNALNTGVGFYELVDKRNSGFTGYTELFNIWDIGGYGGANYGINNSYIKVEFAYVPANVIRVKVTFRNWFLKAGGYYKVGKTNEDMFPGFTLSARVYRSHWAFNNPTIQLPDYYLVKNF